jgi:hypothetical protein
MLSVTSGDLGGVLEQPSKPATANIGTNITNDFSDFISLLELNGLASTMQPELDKAFWEKSDRTVL